MATAAVSSKGQITIPLEVRRKLGIKSGDRVRFVEGEKGEFVFKPKDQEVEPTSKLVFKRNTGTIMDMKGCIEWTGKPVTIEEMNETIAKGWAGQLIFED
jgi:AbrB family looped-hinge helix DNA binding protein